MDESSGRNDTAPPFLSIVTRHLPGRAELLERNRANLEHQTDRDFEQIVITDEERRGYEHMHAMLSEVNGRITGEYVLILDDDDFMIALDGVECLKQATADHPPAVIFRGKHADLGVLPRTDWGRRPVMGDIGSFDFILRADVYREFAGVPAASAYACDHAIISAAYDAHSSEIVWLDKVICAADRRRQGQDD